MVTVAGVVVEENGRILCIRRAPEKRPYPNMIGTPWGRVEGVENVRTAAKREAKEEACVEVALTGRAASTELFDGNEIILFEALIINGVPRAGDQCTEVLWLTVDELRRRDDVVPEFLTILDILYRR